MVTSCRVKLIRTTVKEQVNPVAADVAACGVESRLSPASSLMVILSRTREQVCGNCFIVTSN